MTSECLRTFIQISDLHMGDLDAGGQLVHDRGMRTLWTLFSLFTGMAGHETKALVHLTEFYQKMRDEDPNVALLVTGDLTSTGKQSQFDRAVQFLGDVLPPPSPRGQGLQTGTWLEEATRGTPVGPHQVIPGNHDHWPGRLFWVVGRPRPWMRTWARDLPLLQQTPIPLQGNDVALQRKNVRLRFLCLNSDADVWGWGPERVLGRGSFRTQLRRLEDDLSASEPPDPNEVRVLLVHHSLLYRAGSHEDKPPSGLGQVWQACQKGLGLLEMNKASRRRLGRLMGQLDIPVLLTGHTHKASVRRWCALSPARGRPLPFLEACCGTTTQLNKVPRKWRSLFSRRGRDPRARELDTNTLLVHRVSATGGQIRWRTETWIRDHEAGFQPAPGNTGGEPWASELLVWPRPAYMSVRARGPQA
jgi:hypothetical protein